MAENINQTNPEHTYAATYHIHVLQSDSDGRWCWFNMCDLCLPVPHNIYIYIYAQKNDFRSHTNATADMGCKYTVLWFCLTINETLKWLSSLPILIS